ncbi:MAG: 6-bladed beta-propeller [Niabella sp.]
MILYENEEYYFSFDTTYSLYAQTPSKIRINPEQAYGGTVSDYFDSVEYIPLETTKESTLGFVYDYIITDSSIVINDPDTHSVYFFSPEGKYITKIRDNINDLRIDKDHAGNKILVFSEHPLTEAITIKRFSLTGKLLELVNESIPLREIKSSTTLEKDYTIKCNRCRVVAGEKPKDSTVFLVSVYRNGQLHKSFLPYNPSIDMAFCSIDGGIDLPHVIQNGTVYFSTGLDYNLYKLTKDTLLRIGRFVFPADRSIPDEVIHSKDLDYLQSRFEYNTKLIRSVSNIFFRKNLLFFKVNGWMYDFSNGSESNNQYNFILDTVTRKLVSMERIIPDEKNWWLPFCETTIKIYGLRYHNDWLYTNLSSLRLFTEYEKNKDKKITYPPVLQQYFKTQNRKSNPVIVKMKLK